MSEQENSSSAVLENAAEGGEASTQNNQEQSSQQSAVPSYSSPFDIYGDDGVKPENVAKIPDQYSATRNFLSKYKSLDALDNAIKHQGYLNSMKGFERPGPDASESDVNRFNQTLRSVLQIPDSIDGYGVQRPEGVPEEAWNQMGMNEYLEVAMKHNVAPEAFRALLELDIKRAQAAKDGSVDEQKRMIQADLDNMRQKHGTHWDTMEAQAARTAELVKLDPAKLENPSTMTKGDLVELLAEVSKLTGESRLPNSNSSSDANQSKTLAEQINDIQTNKANPLHADYMGENGQAAQKKANAEVTRLTTLQVRTMQQQRSMGGSR